MKQIFLDVETQKTFDQVGGYHPDKLGVSFVGIIERDDSGKETEKGFFESDLTQLWPILERADLIIGFNIVGFDMPALQPYYSGKVSDLPVLDILERIKESAGHRISLDALAQETLKSQKSGSGLDAIKYYSQGKLEELVKYCLQDVALTRDIYDYGCKHKKVKFKNKWNEMVECAVQFDQVDFSHAATQMTLMGI